MLISSMLIFGTIGIFRRFIPLSSGLLAFARGLLGTGFICLFVKIKRRRIFLGIGKKTAVLLACSGAVIGANWICLFEAFNHTTVPIATLCNYMQPTIVILLSPLVVKERLTGKKLLCALVSIVGMVFVSGILSGTDEQNSDAIGIVLGLASAVLYACAVLLNKRVVVKDAYEKTVIQLGSTLILLLPYLILTEDFSAIRFEPFALIMLVVVGLIHTGVAYVLYFGGMGALKAQSIAVLSYIDPVSALILSAIFLNERLTICGLIGAVLIIGATLVSEVDFSAKREKIAD